MVYAQNVFGGKYHFLFLQLGWVAVGLVSMILVAKSDLGVWQEWSGRLFMLSLFFLLFVLLPTPFSPELYGARRWIILNPAPLPSLPVIGRLGFQPTEFAKLAWVVYLAALLDKKGKLKKEEKAVPIIVALLVLVGLVVIQPDLGSSLLLAGIGLGTFFISGAPLATFVGLFSLLGVGGLGFALAVPYRRQRLLTFLDPSKSDPLNAGYHLRQVLIAIGSGGILGMGLGQSRQKYGYLPEVTGDSIFAVICEETGLLGATFLIGCYLFLLWRIFKLAAESPRGFRQLLPGAIAIWFSLQILINLGAMVSLVPMTGSPLPLVSYGGSSLVFSMIALGLVLNISRHLEV